MASQKSTSPAEPAARAPQRRRGQLRVAALLEAAAAIFAEKGFDAATMTEIAARAKAPIGSLYQFFPSKEALADALLERFGDRVAAAFRAIEARNAAMSATALADALLDLMVELRDERRAAMMLLDSRRDAFARPSMLRQIMLEGINRILRAQDPTLPQGRADDIAAAVLQTMKGMAALTELDGGTAAARVAEEWRIMTRLYLAKTLDRSRSP